MYQNEILTISHLKAGLPEKPIVEDVSMTVRSGEVHVVMGPNGSGKSTLSSVLMGQSAYQIQSTHSVVTINDTSLLDKPPEERAKLGLFLSFQTPIAIPGVSSIQLLRHAYQEIHGASTPSGSQTNTTKETKKTSVGDMSMGEFLKVVKAHAKILRLNENLLSRGVHDGMSGGERKKLEMVQALVLQPKFAIFDEIDTGLDVDALRMVAMGIASLKNNGTGIILVTHYQRLLQYIAVDVVHILVNGTIVETGDGSLASHIEKHGYTKFQKNFRQ